MISREDIRAACGELIICGISGSQVNAEVKELLREVRPLGIILFNANIESPEHVCGLNAELKNLSPKPLLCTVDQEGGRVLRIPPPATQWPSMRVLGNYAAVAVDKTAAVTHLARLLANQTRSLNFDMSFAPVLDVDTNPNNPVIGDRAFSSDSAHVAACGYAFITALQQAGIAACGKHFPGHGDTDVDSHLALPIVYHDLARLQQLEWPPFVAAVKAQVAAIMTAHVVLPALCPESRPATLSAAVLQHVRTSLKHPNALISDDINMAGVARDYSIDEIATLGLNAGNDIFLACKDIDRTVALYRALVQACEQKKVTTERLLMAQQRARTLAATYVQPPHPFTGHQYLMDQDDNFLLQALGVK